MKTAVQELKKTGLRCAVMFGFHQSVGASKKGPVKVFDEGQVVLFGVAQKGINNRIQGYLFRTGKGNSEVPGVFPSVTILAYAERKNQLTRLRRTMAWLHKTGYQPKNLSDTFS